MTDPQTCEIRGCDQPAAFGVVFASPAERVDYCEGCVAEIKRDLDYQAVLRL